MKRKISEMSLQESFYAKDSKQFLRDHVQVRLNWLSYQINIICFRDLHFSKPNLFEKKNVKRNYSNEWNGHKVHWHLF